ncbi:MAG: hypothetical protein LBF12_00515 [Christensenellaceae bacterium]|jgi:hypothetical protein|nr:hypothetical protein [Christensenellaceae bacterium]
MVFTFDDLILKYHNFTDVKGKIRRDVQSRRLIQIRRGLYESDSQIAGEYLAGLIYGPSYLSFDYALYTYSMIPETVYNTYTSATFLKNKTKLYTNAFGTFTYRDVPSSVYNIGVEIRLAESHDYSYQIASPEKALCDKLYSLSPVRSLRDLREMLFDDLRIDLDEFKKLKFADIRKFAPLYNSTSLKLLTKFVEDGGAICKLF